MREVRGRTLREVIAEARGEGREEPVALRRLLAAWVAVAQAVAYAHEQGVVHRDIKPDNLMIGAFGEVLVLDWGIARARPGAGGPEGPGTQAGAVLGAPGYLAPEQARGEGGLGPPVDAYALGALLYEILAGEGPYAQGGRAAWEAVLRGPPPPLGSRREGLPAELVAICEAAMAAQDRDLAELRLEQGLHAALELDAALDPAHEALADLYRTRLEAAEARRDEGAGRRYALLLGSHDRGRHRDWLHGDGALTLHTRPSIRRRPPRTPRACSGSMRPAPACRRTCRPGPPAPPTTRSASSTRAAPGPSSPGRARAGACPPSWSARRPLAASTAASSPGATTWSPPGPPSWRATPGRPSPCR